MRARLQLGRVHRLDAPCTLQRWAPRPALAWSSLVAGLACLAAALQLADAGTAVGVVTALCVVAAATSAGATIALFVWAAADTTRVFRSRSLALVTGAMTIVAAVAIARLATSSLLTRLLATGGIGAREVVDLTCLVVALVALVGVVVGVAECASAHRLERRWADELRRLR